MLGRDFCNWEKIMNRSYQRYTFSALVILFAITACVLPGQTAQPQAIRPTPGIDSNAVATAVAGTAQAAAQQTASSELFAPSLTGTAIEQLSDGTTKYSDYDGGFEIILPAGWLALIPNSEEFNAALAQDGAVNPMLRDQMTLDQSNYEPNFDRLYLYILRPDIEKNVIFGFSKLAWDSADGLPIDSITMGQLTRELEAPGGIPGFRADTVQLHEDTSVKMIEIGGHWTMNDEQGEATSFYSVGIFFKPSSDSTARLLFTFVNDYQAQISPDVKSVMASIKLIEPGQ
jgi:hypothetical protein